MKAYTLLLLLTIIITVGSCSTAKEPSGVWVNKEKIQGKSFDSVFIVALTANVQARVMVENDLAAAAAAKGYKTVKSYDLLPPSLDDPKPPSKDEIVSKVKASGCDAVLLVSLLRKEEDVHYVPGKTAYGIMPHYTYYTGYYSHYYPTVNKDGYYSKDKEYFVLSNLYDATSEEIMWSVQSKVFNPSTLEKFSKDYTSSLVKQMEKENARKKK